MDYKFYNKFIFIFILMFEYIIWLLLFECKILKSLNKLYLLLSSSVVVGDYYVTLTLESGFGF